MLKFSRVFLLAILLPITLLLNDLYAQHLDALTSKEFLLEKRTFSHPSGRPLSVWLLCLNDYTVMISGQKRHIPIFPVYTESCFNTVRDRAVDVLERACNALDCMLHGEYLEIYSSPSNGNFYGSAIWSMPKNMEQEHPSLVFRIDDSDISHFGFRADNTEKVARYVKNIFEVMRTLFIKHSNPSNSPAMRYPDVKILKRIWLDARQHAEKIRNVPPEKSAQSVTQSDIQEAIDMLSESQRLRLLGIALLIPEEM